jgi:hypothetical protein
MKEGGDRKHPKDSTVKKNTNNRKAIDSTKQN